MTAPLSDYPKAKQIGVSGVNVGGALVTQNVRLFVIHIAQSSTQSGIDAWFNDPAAKVSAHFSIARNGVVHQYVSLHTVSWAQANYNDVSISIEHVGYSGQTLKRAQLNASLELLHWLGEQFPDVPVRRTADPSGRGVIGHGELGVAGGDHPDCPGAPVLAQFDVRLRTAAKVKRGLPRPK